MTIGGPAELELPHSAICSASPAESSTAMELFPEKKNATPPFAVAPGPTARTARDSGLGWSTRTAPAERPGAAAMARGRDVLGEIRRGQLRIARLGEPRRRRAAVLE